MDKIRSIFQRVVWFASNSVQSLDRILNRHSGCLFCLLHPWTQSKLEIGSSILCWFGPPTKPSWLGLSLIFTYLPFNSIHTFFNRPQIHPRPHIASTSELLQSPTKLLKHIAIAYASLKLPLCLNFLGKQQQMQSSLPLCLISLHELARPFSMIYTCYTRMF